MSTAVPTGAPAYLKTQADFGAWIPNDVAKLFWERAKNDKGVSWVIGMQNTLRANTTAWQGIETAYIFRLVPLTGQSGQAVIQGGQLTFVGAQYETAQPRTLEEANRYYAASLAAECPREMALYFARIYNVRTDIGDQDMRAAVALEWAQRATAVGKSMPQIEREQRAMQAVQGAGSTASEFFKDVGDWIGGVVIKNLGRVLYSIGEQILKLRDSTPWVGKYFLDPLGFTAQAVLLQEMGRVAYTGSISTFNEARFGFAVGQLLTAAGTVLAIVAPILPPPFNIAAAALAALSIAIGNTLQRAIAQQARQREEEAEQERLEELAEIARQEQLRLEQEVAEAEEAAALAHAEAEAAEAELRALGVEQTPTEPGPRSIAPALAVAGSIAAALTVGALVFIAWK